MTTLAEHLRRHHHGLETLMALLTDERELLAKGNIDGEALAGVAARKQQTLAELERFEGRRRQVQARLGYPDDRDGDEQAAREAGCLVLWRAIRTGAERARRLNQLNGGLIGLRLEGNQRLLDTLQTLTGQGLYGPDGQARGGGGGLSSRA